MVVVVRPAVVAAVGTVVGLVRFDGAQARPRVQNCANAEQNALLPADAVGQ